MSALQVRSPLPGRLLALSDVPDPVFAGALVGPGVAVDPPRHHLTVVAPVDGRIAKLHAHAFVIVGSGDRAVLVHLGIDTVQLNGAGFDVHVAEGDVLRAGDPVISWDPSAVEASGRSPVCPVVALDARTDALTVSNADHADGSDVLFRWA